MCSKRPPLPPFEFDVRKSRVNKLKHGIDFVEAQALWMVDALDNEAVRLAVTRQSVIRVWLSERIDRNWRALEAEDARRKKQTG